MRLSSHREMEYFSLCTYLVMVMLIFMLDILENARGNNIPESITEDEDYMDMESQPRVVGGDPAKMATFPFIVSIQVRGVHNCGGSLLTFRWVLSAAHCLSNPRAWKITTVTAGSRYVNRGNNFPIMHYQQRRYAKRVIPHEDYDRPQLLNDIGLIQVYHAFFHTARVAPVKIPLTGHPELDPHGNDPVIVAGWGRTKFHGRTSPFLQAVDLNLVSSTDCQAYYYFVEQPPYMFYCAKAKNRTACKGDSGGPLIHEGIQIGIVSYGVACSSEWPSVYTRVDSYLDWIESHTKGHRLKADCVFLLLSVWIFLLR